MDELILSSRGHKDDEDDKFSFMGTRRFPSKDHDVDCGEPSVPATTIRNKGNNRELKTMASPIHRATMSLTGAIKEFLRASSSKMEVRRTWVLI